MSFWPRQVAGTDSWRECINVAVVIARDKRKAFAQGSEATKQSSFVLVRWIASRSLSSGARSRDPVARNDGLKPSIL
jgi:hypothetical protein